MTSDGQSTSLWMTGAPAPASPDPACKNLSADVCIIGAGIAGLSAAYHLAAYESKSVVVLDDGPIGGGQTERTSAHLSNVLDQNYFFLENLHGESKIRLIAESHGAAIDRIEKIVSTERLDCEFERVDGYLLPGAGESEALLERELAAARRAGFGDVELIREGALPRFDAGPCLRFPRQAQFHPLKYVKGLAGAIVRCGGLILTGRHAKDISDGAPAEIRTEDGLKVTASAVIIATNAPIKDQAKVYEKQTAYTTYVIGVKFPSGSIAKALYWDTAEPYHYVRLHTGLDAGSALEQQIVLIGGEDHKTGRGDDGAQRYARLESWARARFPFMEDVRQRWSGQVMESHDGLGLIGRSPGKAGNVFLATGDCGAGLTHGTIAGMLLTDLIIGRGNPWTMLYDPAREVARPEPRAEESEQSPPKVVKAGGLLPGTGALLRRGAKKLAVYVDDQGRRHEMSAACPHLGCPVAWNSSEKTWDCPCHGSRFDAYGNVINGPANKSLETVKVRLRKERVMARYGKKAAQKVKKAMHERKKGTLKSGRSGKKVTSRKQAIAIGLSEARRAGGKVPRKAKSKKK